MQQALLVILLVLFSLYFLLIGYYRHGWRSIQTYRGGSRKLHTAITVIIPARNEEKYIGACLDSVCNQTYPKHLYEVLVVDDHSTDSTATIVRNHTGQNIQLISLQDFVGSNINSYKKKAIAVAVEQATGELIVTTDADCFARENWLQTMAAFYEENQAQFIAAPVAIHCSNRFIEFFQGLDFMTLQGITGASVHKKIHSMCNGANLAFSKKAFNEVAGYTGIDHIASGDDMLLMHKIFRRYPEHVLFLKSKEAIVQTAPVPSIRAFFNQRIRWASKADKYDDKRIIAVLALVYLVNLLLLLLPVVAVFYHPSFSLFHFQVSLIGLWGLLFFTKTIVELFFLYPVASFFNKQRMLWLFPLLQPAHVLYTVIAGWLGKFGSYNWKERQVK